MRKNDSVMLSLKSTDESGAIDRLVYRIDGGDVMLGSTTIMSDQETELNATISASDLKLGEHSIEYWVDNGAESTHYSGNIYILGDNQEVVQINVTPEDAVPKVVNSSYAEVTKVEDVLDKPFWVVSGNGATYYCSASRDGYEDTRKEFTVDVSQYLQIINYEMSPIKYTITLNTNGGTFTDNSWNKKTYTINDSVTLPSGIGTSKITRSGKTFKGWFEDQSFNESSVESIPSGSTGNKTYYAKWEDRVLTSIRVTTPPTNTIYTVGATFSPDGMVVTAYYDNGESANVTGYTCTGDLSSEGEKLVTITYTDNGVTKSTTQSVRVVNGTLSGVAIATNPTLSYTYGDKIDLSALKVTLSFTVDSSTSTVEVGYKEVSVYAVKGDTETLLVHGATVMTVTDYNNCNLKVKSGTFEYTTTDKITVNKAALTITVNDTAKTYGDENPDFTVTCDGLVNGDTLSSLAESLSYKTDANATSNVGEHNVSVDTDNSNINTDNYNINYVVGKLKINVRNLTITADNKSRAYGEANPTFTYKCDGLVNGDELSNVVFSCDATKESSVSASGYDIVITCNDTLSNYTVKTQNGKLYVLQAEPTLATIGTIYGKKGKSLSDVPVPGTVTGKTKGTYAWTGEDIAFSEAKTYTAYVNFTPESSNYKTVNNIPVQIKVKEVLTAADFSFNDTAIYDGSAHSVTITKNNAKIGGIYNVRYADSTGAPSDVGSYTIKINVQESGDYEAATDLVIGTFTIKYLDAPQTPYTINGAAGVNGWYRSNVTIYPASGYTISKKLGSDYADSLTFEESVQGNLTVYLKNSSGQMTDAINVTETIKIDKSTPSAKISLGTGKEYTTSNYKSYKFFKKGNLSFTVSGTPNENASPISSVAYQIVDSNSSYNENSWTYGTAGSVTANKKLVIYAKVINEAGTEVIINSEGIVVYTDSAQGTSSIRYTRTTKDDVDASVTLNGNTIKCISYNSQELTLNTDYSVSEAVIKFKGEYLEKLSAGSYTFKVSYDPMGENYVEGDKPAETEISCTISKKDLELSDLSYDLSPVTYDGTSKSVAISPAKAWVTLGEITYKFSKNNVEDSEHKDAGDYKITISVAEGEYYNAKNSLEITTTTNLFKILPKEVLVNWCEDDFTYNGQNRENEITASYLNVENQPVSLTVTKPSGGFKEHSNGAGYTFRASFTNGESNYKLNESSASKDYHIKQLSLSDSLITVEPLAAQIASGEIFEPQVTVKLKNSEINAANGGYRVAYTDNINVGFAQVHITGNTNFKDTIIRTFEIKSKPQIIWPTVSAITYGTALKDAALVGGTSSTYGSFSFVNSSSILSAGTNVEQIKFTPTTQGINNGYSEETNYMTITVLQKSIYGFTASVNDIDYTGSVVVPSSVSLKKDAPSTELNKDSDYIVTYSNNVNAGTATATFRGIGNYSGELIKIFNINPKTLSNENVTVNGSYTYTGQAITPKPSVTCGGKTLVENQDYTLSYSNNTNAGTATVTVTGIGNYSSTALQTFTINKATPTLSAKAMTATYTGAEITFDKDNVTLKGVSEADTPSGTLSYKYYDAASSESEVEHKDAKTYYVGVEFTPADNSNYESASLSQRVLMTIKPVNVSELDVKLGYITCTYNRRKQEPDVTINFGSTDVKNSCSVTYENNENVGTALVKIEGSGNFAGTRTETFVITQANISDKTVNITETGDFIYTGEALKPEITVGDLTTEREGKDYTVSYANNINAGTATITVKGILNYSGETSKTFSINPKSLSDSDVTVNGSYTYTGQAITPKPSVKVGEKTLVENQDYTLSYSNNTNAGENTATVTVTGIGNYSSTALQTFTINKATPTLSAKAMTATYTGAEITFDKDNVTLKGVSEADTPSGTLSYKYYDAASSESEVEHKDAKTYYVGVEFTPADNSNYESASLSQRVLMTVKPVNVSELDVKLAYVTATYDGTAKTPDVTINFGSTDVKNSCNVTYENNENVGTALVKIEGSGNFAGTRTETFVITQANISDKEVKISETDGFTYTGEAIKPEITVGDLAEEREGKDYTVSYANNISAGTATITVKGILNYSGETSKTFSINPKSLSDSDVTVNGSYTYTGQAITPKPSVTCGGKTLVENQDYTLSYSNNTNAGTATVKVTGIGNYGGDPISKPFTIIKATPTVAMKELNVTYTGDKISFTDENIVITGVSATDKSTGEITVSYYSDENCSTSVNPNEVVKAGTYYVKAGISECANYKSIESSVAKMIIQPTSISNCFVEQENLSYDYNGAQQKPTNLRIIFNGQNLTVSTDYELEYGENVNVGTATLKISGKGNFSGTRIETFSITQKLINSSDIKIKENDLSDETYTGDAIAKKLNLSMGDKNLSEGQDYVLSYANNINVGTATITIKGLQNYGGERVVNFAIVKNSIANGEISISGLEKSYEYTGQWITPSIAVSKSARGLVQNQDYILSFSKNLNVGDAEIIIQGIGNYAGTKKFSFGITAAKPRITLSTTTKNYDGTSQVFEDDYTTVKGVSETDFSSGEISYTYYKDKECRTQIQNPTDAGIYYVKAKIEKNGNYSDSDLSNIGILKIVSASIDECSVEIGSVTYTGGALEPSCVVRFRGTETNDYTVKCSDNVNAGMGTIMIIGKNNFSGTRTEYFTINPKNIGSTEITAPRDQYYTGQSIASKPTVSGLIENTDYLISYSNNINVGTAKVKVSGIGNYTGEVESEFSILPTKPRLTLSSMSKTYTGKGISFEDDYANVTGVSDIDVSAGQIVYSYFDQTNKPLDTLPVKVGTYIVRAKIKSSGNYSETESSNEAVLKITPLEIEECEFEINDNACVYNGSLQSPVLKVKLNGDVLLLSTDYNVKCSNNLNAGTATIKINGQGNFSGSYTDTFDIKRRNISNAVIEDIGSYTYTGSTITPVPSVKDKDLGMLSDGVDYVLSYSNNINPGNGAVVRVAGNGNYEGVITGNFVINAAMVNITYSSSYNNKLISGKEREEISQGSALNEKLLEDLGTFPIEGTQNKYVFLGWYSDPFFTVNAVIGQTVSQNITLYAKWGIKGDFNGNGKIDNEDISTAKTLSTGGTVAYGVIPYNTQELRKISIMKDKILPEDKICARDIKKMVIILSGSKEKTVSWEI